MSQRCSLPLCDKPLETPTVECRVTGNTITFVFCSPNHASLFLAYPERHWPEAYDNFTPCLDPWTTT